MGLDHIGGRIRFYREQKGLTVAELAQGIVSPQMVELIEQAVGDSTWKKVEFYAHEQHQGHLFRSNEFPDQWKWRGNIVFANSVEEARAKFVQQLRPQADYWERLGGGRFMWLIGWYRGAIYRHRGDRTLLKFKDFDFMQIRRKEHMNF